MAAPGADPLLQEGGDFPPWGRGGELCGLRCPARALPRWAYNREVRDLFENHDRSRPLGLLSCAGPSVKWSYWSLLVLWAVYLALPALAYRTSECSGGYARYPPLFTWGLFAPFIVWHAFAQWKSMSFVIPNQLKTTGKFVFLGFIDLSLLPYGVFFSMVSFFTIGCALDVNTNALFMAKVWRTHDSALEGNAECGDWLTIRQLWKDTMAQSMFALVPDTGILSIIHNIMYVEFYDIVVVAYLLVLLRPLYALVMTCPTRCGQVSYRVEQWKDFRKYRTLADDAWCDDAGAEDMTLGVAVVLLAEANRFEGVVFQSMAYARKKMETLMGGTAFDDIGPDTPPPSDAEMELRFQEYALTEVTRGISRFFLAGLLMNALQLNLQVTEMALVKAAASIHSRAQKYDHQDLLSIVLGLSFSCLPDFPDALDVFAVGRKAVSRNLDGVDDDNVRSLQSSVRVRLKRLVFYMVVYLFAVLYGIVKLIQLYRCPHGLWNITGCVEHV